MIFWWCLSALAAEPSLPAAPEVGVDSDVRAAIAAAEAALNSGAPEVASQELLGLYSSPDRFSVAQRGQVAAQAADLFSRTAASHRAEGQTVRFIRDLDASWLLRGRPADETYAAALGQWADVLYDEGRANEAFYVIDRAVEVSHGGSAWTAQAQRLRVTPAMRVAQVAAGVATIGTAVGGWGAVQAWIAGNALRDGGTREALDARVASRTQGTKLAYAGLAVAAGGTLAYTFTMTWGSARPSPTSPPNLPALPEVP